LKHLDGKLKAAVLVEKRGKLMKNIVLVAVVSLSALVAGTAVAQSINAAGATFPAPIYQKWFGDYKTAHPSIQINYQAIGSGGGIKQLTEGTVDFGASDKPMSDAEIAAVKVKPLHFPTVLGGVVLVYNIPGVETGLKLSGDTIAGIYLGDIRKWNDAKLKADNPKAALHGRQRHLIRFHRLPLAGERRLEEESWREYGSAMAGGYGFRCQGKRRNRGHHQATAFLHRLRGAAFRRAEQDEVR
jgi:ABC-type phosphate transport system substrate-binding protein